MSEVDTVVLMDLEEARETVGLIRSHINSARMLLFRLYEREGWRALGYASWGDCIRAEFAQSVSYLSRQLLAARVEHNAGIEVGTLRESWVREVRDVLDDESEQAAAALAGLARNASSAEEWRLVAIEWYLHAHGHPVVVERVNGGLLGLLPAYDIQKAAEATHTLVALVTDAKLARLLHLTAKELPVLWQEILATEAIPTITGEQIPLGEATADHLLGYLVGESSEERRVFIETHRDYYDALGEARDKVITTARFVVRRLGDPESVASLAAALGEYDLIRARRKNHERQSLTV